MEKLHRKIKELGIIAVAKASGLNKSTISRYVHGQRDYSLENYQKILEAVDLLENANLRGRTSARDASKRVANGEDWQIAYFDYVDSFLATKSERLVAQRPVDGLEIRLVALLCSITMQLCAEHKVSPPEWSTLSLGLEEPWFISRFKSLRAISLVESPVFFKRNNIFVGQDFLQRA